jgi:uncharacterized membrane protein
MSDSVSSLSDTMPRVRRVPVDRPWTWLSRGWADLVAVPGLSLGYGLLLVAVSGLLTMGLLLAGLVYLLLPLAAGFFFIAPVLAVCLYEISRRREAGGVATLGDSLLAWRRNGTQIALMGLVLMLLHLAWVRIATLLFALFFHQSNPTLDRLVDALLFSPASLPFLAVGTVVGAILATVAFAIGVVSIPMLLDRDVSVFTAIHTSWRVVTENPAAMALWAALIVVFTTFGIITLYLGLAIAVPLIGYASWHAYRDLVV